MKNIQITSSEGSNSRSLYQSNFRESLESQFSERSSKNNFLKQLGGIPYYLPIELYTTNSIK